MKRVELKIPIEFFDWKYDGKIYPGGKKKSRVKGNCQMFVYEILRANGLTIPDFRSGQLWDDTLVARKIKKFKVFDILLFHHTKEAYAAHVALCIGNNRIIHLSKKIGYPVVWTMSEFLKTKRYKYFIGTKRLKKL